MSYCILCGINKVSAARVKLIFLNRYFHPDISATSQMLTSLALHLASRGSEVHVITSRQRYDDAQADLPASESVGGVHIHRVRTSRFGRQGLAGRAIDYASFYLSSCVRLVSIAKRGDVVIAKTDPPLISVPAGLVARLRGARLVNWLQDVFPEVAARMGMRLGLIAGASRAARDASLRRAAMDGGRGERVQTRGREAGRGARELLPGHHTMCLRGDHGDAEAQARLLLGEFGWPESSLLDLGDITNARGMEMYLALWVRLYGATGTGIFNVGVAVQTPDES